MPDASGLHVSLSNVYHGAVGHASSPLPAPAARSSALGYRSQLWAEHSMSIVHRAKQYTSLAQVVTEGHTLLGRLRELQSTALWGGRAPPQPVLAGKKEIQEALGASSVRSVGSFPQRGWAGGV